MVGLDGEGYTLQEVAEMAEGLVDDEKFSVEDVDVLLSLKELKNLKGCGCP